MKAAELFVKCLENEGVEYIFGVPGEENAHFMMALEDSPIKFVVCRHEQGAAFIADAYGRLTGRPGVCLGTLGPGATNLVTGVADANMDRVPLIVLTGQADSRRQHKESHQNMDVVAMFTPITKWAKPIIHSGNIPEVVRKAFKLAVMEKPGACHIELADDIAAFETAGAPLPIEKPQRPVPAANMIAAAVKMIKTAKKPVILAGNGAIRHHASQALRLFTDLTHIPVTNTFMGKGAVSRQSEHCLFTIGLQSQDHILCSLQQADLVITLGYDTVEYAPHLWSRHFSDKNGQKLIHIDCVPAESDEYYAVDLEIVGDVAQTLELLNKKFTNHVPHINEEYIHTIRSRQLEDFMAHKDDDTKGTIRPQKILWDVRQVMGPDDILISDVGAHKMWIARYYQCDEPNTCLISNGFCSMGFALPAAIGAKIVHPERKVLAICGDGGFLMNVQELETARRIGANIVVMIWDDQSYGLIEWKQQNTFGRHTDLHFNNPDFIKLAEAFGCKGMRVENSADLHDALKEAFKQDVPVLLSVPVDYRENLKLTQRLGNIACPI
ncbi:MAG: acetolactate synthase large subunit [Proteobacteria bacterium]|nr:acetolactate synthase large subunit [Pseudomonadota bacterium]MBU1639377.1 acetolactate synthase large subunit [Pseudomonadota bacterium]